MQLHEIEQQEEAIGKLELGKPEDLSGQEFAKIRNKAKETRLVDFVMRVHEEEQQIDGLRKLRNR